MFVHKWQESSDCNYHEVICDFCHKWLTWCISQWPILLIQGVWRVTPDLFIYLFQHSCTLWIQWICVGTLWSPQNLVRCHILCDLIMVFMTLKEVTASIMAAHYSGLAYNDTLPLCLLLFPTDWNTVINTFIVLPWAVFHAPKHNQTLLNGIIACICHYQWHTTQLLRGKCNFEHWHGVASSHVCYHAGLPSCIMSCQVIKCRHN